MRSAFLNDTSIVRFAVFKKSFPVSQLFLPIRVRTRSRCTFYIRLQCKKTGFGEQANEVMDKNEVLK